MEPNQITIQMIEIRVKELIEDFGQNKPSFWMKLAHEGHELDALEFMALGHLILNS